MDKYSEDRGLLVKALEEAICNRFDKMIGDSPMSADCSEGHKARMAEIIEGADTRPGRLSRAKLIAALIAAALLLTGCTLYVFRNQIKGFVEYIYSTYISVRSDEEIKSNVITDVYKLTYVPEGYELVKERKTAVQVFYRWENDDGRQLEFVQYHLGEFHIDTDDGYLKIVEHNGIEVYCRESKRSYHYCWLYNDNCFSITSYDEISTEELIKMIDRMVIK